MALAFKTVRIKFPSAKGEEQHQDGVAVFDKGVKAADASLKGFNVQYTESDHHLLVIEIHVNNVSINDTKVSFGVDYLLRDHSGNIDDPYEGWIDVLVTADA